MVRLPFEDTEKNRSKNINNQNNPRYRYSGVFIDIIVSVIIFSICAIVMLVGLKTPRIAFLIYCALISIFLLGVIGVIGIPLLSRKNIFPSVNCWASRHILGK